MEGRRLPRETIEKVRKKLFNHPVAQKTREKIRNSQRTGRFIKCLTCAREFYANPSTIKQGKKYCSKECYAKSLRGKRPKQLNTPENGRKISRARMKNSTGIYLSCKFCGKRFYTTQGQIKQGRKFCSRYCSDKGRRKRPQPTPEKIKIRKEKRYIYQKKWRENNPEKFKRIQKQYHDKIAKTPEGKINHSMHVAIREALKAGKGGRRWETLVGYTLKELMFHLESQFDGYMNWTNYGIYWQVHHKKPKSLFHYCAPGDSEFQECWSLRNLQPLEGIANARKGNRYIT